MFHPHHFEASFFRVHVSTAWLVAQERRQNDRANDYAHHDARLRHVGKLQAKILQTNGCCSSLHGNKWSGEQQLKKVTRENWPSNILAMACNGRENPFQTHWQRRSQTSHFDGVSEEQQNAKKHPCSLELVSEGRQLHVRSHYPLCFKMSCAMQGSSRLCHLATGNNC